MTNMKVQFKRLERNPEFNPNNSNTVAPYLEKVGKGYLQSYVSIAVAGYQSMEVQAIVLVENKLEGIPLKDIIVLTDEE